MVFVGSDGLPAGARQGAPRVTRSGRFSMGSTKIARTTRLSGSELRRLLELRELIKIESFRLPTGRQRQLLELLERSRPWEGEPPALPEMSRGELARAINWRLGTVSLPTAVAAAALLKRPRRKRA